MKRILLVFACVMVCACAWGASSDSKDLRLTVGGQKTKLYLLAEPTSSDEYVSGEDMTIVPPSPGGEDLFACLLVGTVQLELDSRKLAADMAWTAKIVNSSGATKKSVSISWEDKSDPTYAAENKWTLTATLDGGTPVDMLAKSSFAADITAGEHTLIVHAVERTPAENHAPEASIAGSGTTAKEGSAFTCVINASDADGDALQFKNCKLDGASIAGTVTALGGNKYRFTSTNALGYDFVAHPATSRTVVFSVDVTDGVATVAASGNVTVQDTNRDPVAGIASGVTAQEGGVFTCVVNASDADGDELQLTNFKLDGAAIAGTATAIGGNQWRFTSANPLGYDFVAHPATSRGVVFSADVADGVATVAASGNVTIQDVNRAPAGTGSVKVSPASPKTTQNVVATASGMTDPDGDAVTYEFTWTTQGTSVVAATLPADRTGKGQIWTLSVVAKDGSGGETELPGKTVEIANSAPSIENARVVLLADELGNATAELDLSQNVSDPDGAGDIASIEIDDPTSLDLPNGGTLSIAPQGAGKFLVQMASEGGVQEFSEGMNFTAKVTDKSGAAATALVTVVSQGDSVPWYPYCQLQGGGDGTCQVVLRSAFGEELMMFVKGEMIRPADYYEAGFGGFLPGDRVEVEAYEYDFAAGERGGLFAATSFTVADYGLPPAPRLDVAPGADANSFVFTVDAPVSSCYTIELRDRDTDAVCLRQRRAFAPDAEGGIGTEEGFLFQVDAPGNYTVVAIGENPAGAGDATDGTELDCGTAVALPFAWPSDATFDNGGAVLPVDGDATHLPVLFRWTAVPGADSYCLNVESGDVAGKQFVLLGDGEAFRSLSLRLSLGESTAYSWQVIARRGDESIAGPVQSFRIVRAQPYCSVASVGRQGNALVVHFTSGGERPVSAEIILFDEDAYTSRWRYFLGGDALPVPAEGDSWNTGLALKAGHVYQVRISLVQENGERGEPQQFRLP